MGGATRFAVILDKCRYCALIPDPDMLCAAVAIVFRA